MNLLVFNTLNSDDQLNGCRYFLLKYLQIHNLKPPAGIGIRIFTRDLALFEQFTAFFPNIELVSHDAERIQSWMGQKESVYRLTNYLIRDVLAEDDHRLAFMDCDVYPVAPLEPLFEALQNDYLILQEDRQEAASLTLSALESVLSSIQYPAPIEPDFQVMHAGVVGIGSRYESMLDEVISLSDKLQGKLSKVRANNLAYTKVFRTTGRLMPAPESLACYRYLPEFKWLLKKFFEKNQEESIPGMIKSLQLISPGPIEEKKKHYEALPVYKKILQTLSGRKWSIREYEKRI